MYKDVLINYINNLINRFVIEYDERKILCDYVEKM